MDIIKQIICIVIVAFFIWFTIYSIWNGWNVNFKSGDISIYFEQYPAKRFFVKSKNIYKSDEVVESKPEDAF